MGSLAGPSLPSPTKGWAVVARISPACALTRTRSYALLAYTGKALQQVSLLI